MVDFFNSKAEKIANFNPSGIGNTQSGIFGLPFDYHESEVVIIPVPWDVTVSYSAGTANGPEAVFAASPQLDLYDFDVPHAWKAGYYMLPISKKWYNRSEKLRPKAARYIHFLENGGDLDKHPRMQRIAEQVNLNCAKLKEQVKKQALQVIADRKIPAVLGGDHSSPLGLLEALAETQGNFGILQIDAHADLREAYEGFTYSHASIMYNALKIKEVERLVSVGVRDVCEAEIQLAAQSDGRIVPFYDYHLQEKVEITRSQTWAECCAEIVTHLPTKVYISFDIDGLTPAHCPHTGTPVAGGLMPAQAFYLVKEVVRSGRTIIGFDLCEVAPNPHHIADEWDANVGARVLYKLGMLAAKSQDLI